MADADDKPTFTHSDLALVGDEPGDRKAQLLSRIGTDEYTEADARELASLISGKAPTRQVPERSDADRTFDDTVPDDASGYSIPDRPDGEARSELDLRLIDKALERFHGAGFTRAQAAAAIEALDAAEAEVARLHDEAATAAHDRAEAALQAKWGTDYERKIGIGNAFLRNTLGAALGGSVRPFMEARLPNGERVGDQLGLIEWAVAQGERMRLAPVEPDDGGDNDEDGATPARSETGLAALLQRRDAILNLMHTDEKAYARAQPELARIIAALNERGAG